MCVLALWVPADAAGSLVVGANRDEAYARPSAPPAEIEPGIVAGRDLLQGGTWLGYTSGRLLVAVTNRRVPPRTADSASRGTLTLEALRCGSLEEIDVLVRARVAQHAYGGFNLVAVQGGEGLCFHFDGALREVRFGPGAHVISSDYDLDAEALPEKQVFERFFPSHEPPDDTDLAAFLSSHEGTRPVCKHGEHFGTVSSAILRLGSNSTRLLFADGAPCEVGYQELLRG